ncbi:lipopolysaccharide heptosyltransferase I [Ramlibacter sp.]|uniref:lipopolysaccharide heptosyltransferase I n=1 Tax=Ramlibacter sp. TaxID=1917967 RepID=UPI0035AE0AC6
MKILIVKLSSLGDVVHAMPAVQDILAAVPDAQVDWVVERGFAPLVARCRGVHRVVPCELRRWRREPLSADTRAAWRAFRADLRQEAYDAVIDLQGLAKSALVARLARLAPGGRRFAMANRTEGSSYEAPTRWVADVAIPLAPRVHAVQRSRLLCAAALGYEVPAVLRQGLAGSGDGAVVDPRPCVAFVHGTSRDDKCWPEPHWIELGRRLLAAGFTLGLPQGGPTERERAERLAAALGPLCEVWASMALDALTERLARCAGVIGVDSGLSHIAVALDLPHVQIYNFDTDWRTGPQGAAHQCSVRGDPTPTVDAVWSAWQAVQAAAGDSPRTGASS